MTPRFPLYCVCMYVRVCVYVRVFRVTWRLLKTNLLSLLRRAEPFLPRYPGALEALARLVLTVAICGFGLVAALSDVMFTQPTGLQAPALVKPTLREMRLCLYGAG